MAAPPAGADPARSPITAEDVAHVARLSRLALTDEELDRFTGQLAAVLDHAADVAALDTEGVPPTAHPLPLVNVLFLVLMLFAMSSRFVLQPGLGVTLPFTPFVLEPQRHPVVVSVTAAPVPAIYHLDRKVSLAELDSRLAASRVQQRSLIIKADRSTPYELVVEIMNTGLRHGFAVVLARMGVWCLRVHDVRVELRLSRFSTIAPFGAVALKTKAPPEAAATYTQVMSGVL